MRRETISKAPVRRRFAIKITAAWNRQVESIIETGKLLLEAKASLPHGEFGKLFHSNRNERDGVVPFGQRTANALMQIAAHPVLSNPQWISSLPPSWGTLSDLAAAPERRLRTALRSGSINAEMSRADAQRLIADWQSTDRPVPVPEDDDGDEMEKAQEAFRLHLAKAENLAESAIEELRPFLKQMTAKDRDKLVSAGETAVEIWQHVLDEIAGQVAVREAAE